MSIGTITEDEWNSTTDVYSMLWALGDQYSDRKLRLFVIACCRRVWAQLRDARYRTAIEAAELYIEGKLDERALQSARKDVITAKLASARGTDGDKAWALRAELVALAASNELSRVCAMALFNTKAQGINPTGVDTELPFQADLLREIYGPLPFRPVELGLNRLAPELIAAAGEMYLSKRFADLGALTEELCAAGCSQVDILEHCRSTDPHVRGCWVIDMILGKV